MKHLDELDLMTNEDENEKSPQKSRSWIERLTALLGREPQNREQLMEILQDAKERDVLSGEMLGTIERILQVSEMQVREVMVPKAQMVTVEKDATLETLLPIVIESAHSRFLVIDPKNYDVIGILLAKDLLPYCFQLKDKPFKLADVTRNAMFTPQSKRLEVLLREFRISRNHIAVVLDEYSHVAGLVTIEDVLEQIVGEIEDEYDIEEEDGHIKKLDNHTYIVKAATLIEEFNEYFQADFSNEESDTIGGIVLRAFEHLPKRGENVKLQNFRFKVLHSDNRRIYLLEVKLMKPK